MVPFVFFFNATATPELYTLSLHDALPISYHRVKGDAARTRLLGRERGYHGVGFGGISVGGMVANRKAWPAAMIPDRKSTRLNSSHVEISYAVFCLKKKKQT